MLKFERAIEETNKSGKLSQWEMTKFLNSFLESGLRCVEIKNWEDHYVRVGSCATTIRRSALIRGYGHIMTYCKNGKPYMVNTLIEEDSKD